MVQMNYGNPMRLIIETPADRQWVAARAARLKTLFGQGLTIEDGQTTVLLKGRQPASDPTPERPALPLLEDDPPKT